MFSSKSLLQTVYEPVMNSYVCCMSINLDIENSLKERFCFDDFPVDYVIFRSNCDFVCCESKRSPFEERVGFEPTDRFRPSVFKTDAIDRSAISPTRFLLAQRGWWSITINPKRSLNLPTAVSSSWFKPLGILASPMRALSLCTRDFSDNLYTLSRLFFTYRPIVPLIKYQVER